MKSLICLQANRDTASDGPILFGEMQSKSMMTTGRRYTTQTS